MGQDIGHGLDRFDRPLERSGDIEHQALAHRPRHTTRETPERTGAAHGLGQARASRSTTVRVASGVRSVGEKPVPPVVTTRPTNDVESSTSAAATGATPSGTVRRSTIRKPFRVSAAANATPDRSSRVPVLTDSETVRIFASSATSTTLVLRIRRRSSGEGPRTPLVGRDCSPDDVSEGCGFMLGPCLPGPISRPARPRRGRWRLAEGCFWAWRHWARPGSLLAPRSRVSPCHRVRAWWSSRRRPLSDLLGQWHLPAIPPDKYRLLVDGLVEQPTTLTSADLEAMPRTSWSRTSSASRAGGCLMSTGRGYGCRRSSTRSGSGRERWRSALTPTTAPTRRALRSTRRGCPM